MFFAKICRLFAYVLLVLGCLKVSLGFFGASMENHRAFARRYLGTETTGEAIDEGLYTIVVAVGFGIAWELLKRLREISDKL